MSNASNKSPACPANELPLSPSAYYDSIPLTTQLPLNVAREILREATIRHEEELLPVSPHTGVNVLRNSDCTTMDAIEITERLTATLNLSDTTPAQSLPGWLLDALTGPSAAFNTIRAAANATNDWGLHAELLHYRDLDQKAKAIHDSISSLETEVQGVLADQWLAL